MTPQLPRPDGVSRRDWIVTGIRHTALGGIAMGSLWCLLRPGGSGCHELALACRDCHRLARCELPRGIQTRRAGIHEEAH